MDRSMDERKGYSGSNGGNGGSQEEEGQTKQQSREVARQGQEQASYYAGEVRQRIEDQIDTRKEWASGELSGISKALRQTGEQLREQDQGSIGQYAEQAAGQTDRLADYLHEKQADQLIGEVENFTRSRPSVVLGGAFVIGIAAARFLKSSSGGNGGNGGNGGSQSGSSSQSSASRQSSGTASLGAGEEQSR